ncbi:MAG: hypothetical protein A2218_06785 [Elusimicrobia bacterium RIFOXYA2_FULL_53_38]|nr:MAG: hypothetical protein A2218_06785 [Elusimicrobia bacterium RIFOXYA2_FULL_53_38]
MKNGIITGIIVIAFAATGANAASIEELRKDEVSDILDSLIIQDIVQEANDFALSQMAEPQPTPVNQTGQSSSKLAAEVTLSKGNLAKSIKEAKAIGESFDSLSMSVNELQAMSMNLVMMDMTDQMFMERMREVKDKIMDYSLWQSNAVSPIKVLETELNQMAQTAPQSNIELNALAKVLAKQVQSLSSRMQTEIVWPMETVQNNVHQAWVEKPELNSWFLSDVQTIMPVIKDMKTGLDSADRYSQLIVRNTK